MIGEKWGKIFGRLFSPRLVFTKVCSMTNPSEKEPTEATPPNEKSSPSDLPESGNNQLSAEEISRSSSSSDIQIVDVDDLSELVAAKLVAFKSSFYSSPLPPPEILRGYEEIVSGSAKKILSMAEAEMKHRHATESKIVDSNISRAWWGLLAGFVLSVVAIGGGLIVIALGHDTAGATIATGGTVSLATVFITGKVLSQQKENAPPISPEHQPPANSAQED